MFLVIGLRVGSKRERFFSKGGGGVVIIMTIFTVFMTLMFLFKYRRSLLSGFPVREFR